ncbi:MULTISPECIES: DUF3617 domain-containing protein [unclassified Pseudomonas]|uniref:DUF3617 domain-containing protein n=1 Tax=unclassified Pseudomonas TaxID=196821 RepID=UPI001B32F4B3|nr:MULTISPECIES: DUF3617 domain-containing protein [unclassified Pseudomonas]MBP5943851.1 DUF3617 domain-containing protein [Pseudomonas sp. P9(2020)]MBZ9563119.1 DUF3617 domain-containing protein [Pseudomonas sp. P116]
MNIRLLGLALGLGLALPVGAQAQMLQPGLWEMTSSNVKVDDQPMDVQSILGQLQGQMTPQQRAALEKNGINIGGKGIRACLTPEQVATNDIPLADPQSGCKQQITERNGNQWKFRFSCPKAQGTGVATFLSDREFNTVANGTFNAIGINQKGSLETRAVWLGQDCGAVKPRA